MFRRLGRHSTNIIKLAIFLMVVVSCICYLIKTNAENQQPAVRPVVRKLDMERLHAAYDDVDTLLLFIGYPRSRHTLVSALLDAHPNIILSNELNLIGSYKNNPDWRKIEMFDKIAKRSYMSATWGIRARQANGTVSNYEELGYKVPNQFQGTFDQKLKILGDKLGWFTASHLSTEVGRDLLKQLEDKFNVRAKFIHVVRNPFDNISTMALRLRGLRTGEHTKKVHIPKAIDDSITRYFYIANNCQATRETLGDRIIDIQGEEFVREPTKYLRKICDFLDISCSEDYLRDCASMVDPVPSKTRSLVVWTEKQIQEVSNLMQPLEFLKSYTF